MAYTGMAKVFKVNPFQYTYTKQLHAKYVIGFTIEGIIYSYQN